MQKTKQILAFEQLEAEMELITIDQLIEFTGGTGFNFIDFFNNNSEGEYYFVNDSSGQYIVDNSASLITTGGTHYTRYSTDNGQTWTNSAGSVTGDSGYQQNWFESYIGPNNPNGYSLLPSNMADYFAFYHDIDYDNLGVSGISGVMTDMRTLGADLRLIAGEALHAGGSFDFWNLRSRMEAACVAAGISLGVAYKIISNTYHPF